MTKKRNIWIFPFILMGMLLMLTNCCGTVLTTTAVSNITQTTASCGGNITSDGGATVTVRGVCWSTNQNPTIADIKTTDGKGTGSFTSNITGLTAGTIYYVRAYATNSAGTGYGSAMSFTTQGGTTGTVTDIDGNVYHTVTIGNQEWMAENLAYEPSSGNYWAYDNDNSNVETYGYLYDWETALDVCPTSWHLPSDAEWSTLTTYLGGESVAGGKLKEIGITHWKPNTAATNETGFTALPGGFRNNSGTFLKIGDYGYWWSATEVSATNAWNRVMYYDYSVVFRYSNYKEFWYSVRCVRD